MKLIINKQSVHVDINFGLDSRINYVQPALKTSQDCWFWNNDINNPKQWIPDEGAGYAIRVPGNGHVVFDFFADFGIEYTIKYCTSDSLPSEIIKFGECYNSIKLKLPLETHGFESSDEEDLCTIVTEKQTLDQNDDDFGFYDAMPSTNTKDDFVSNNDFSNFGDSNLNDSNNDHFGFEDKNNTGGNSDKFQEPDSFDDDNVDDFTETAKETLKMIYMNYKKTLEDDEMELEQNQKKFEDDKNELQDRLNHIRNDEDSLKKRNLLLEQKQEKFKLEYEQIKDQIEEVKRLDELTSQNQAERIKLDQDRDDFLTLKKLADERWTQVLEKETLLSELESNVKMIEDQIKEEKENIIPFAIGDAIKIIKPITTDSVDNLLTLYEGDVVEVTDVDEYGDIAVNDGSWEKSHWILQKKFDNLEKVYVNEEFEENINSDKKNDDFAIINELMFYKTQFIEQKMNNLPSTSHKLTCMVQILENNPTIKLGLTKNITLSPGTVECTRDQNQNEKWISTTKLELYFGEDTILMKTVSEECHKKAKALYESQNQMILKINNLLLQLTSFIYSCKQSISSQKLCKIVKKAIEYQEITN